MPSFPGGVGLMIGYPIAGHPVVPEMMFITGMLYPPMNYETRCTIIKGQPVADARNAIAAQALREGCKYLWFQGDDVGTPAHALRQAIYFMEHNPKIGVIGGVYCRKTKPQAEPLVFRGNGQGAYWDWKVGEFFQCSGIGMDCTLIRMDVFKDIPQPWFKTVDSIDAMMDAQNKVETWTEDLFFCHKVEEVKDDQGNQKWEIWCDGSVLAPHYDWKTGEAYTLPGNSKPYQRASVKKGDKKIVDLGCGQFFESHMTPEGEVLRVDIRDDVKPDYRCDIRKLPFNSKEFDVVFSSHTLEHFPVREIESIMDEWVRLLKDDGELRLVLPNIQWAAQHVVNGEIDQDVMNVLYGGQDHAYNFHQCGFTQKMLEQLLVKRGFTTFTFDFHNYHMLCRAWKETPKVKQGDSIENPIIDFDRTVAPAYRLSIRYQGVTRAGQQRRGCRTG